MRPKFSSGSPYEPIIGFCRAVRVGNTIHVSGTAPVGPDRKTVGVGDPAAQTRRCFEIIQEAVEALGGTLNDVVRTRMFLTRIDDWKAVGNVHGEFFAAVRPAATMVQVAQLIDQDWLVEIEAEAIVEPAKRTRPKRRPAPKPARRRARVKTKKR